MTHPLRLPNLSALRAFEATVRHGSISRAAHELSVTDGAVSRAVRELEDELGFALFRRGNRTITATATARVLAEDVAAALDRLREAIARASRASRSDRPLVLSCEPTFLIRWLIPRLSDLQLAVGPERELQLVSAGGAVPFAREGIDLAIRRADFPIASDVVAEPFLEERVGPVCRPDLAATLAGSGPLEGVLLHTETRRDAWPIWAKLAQTQLRATRDRHFEHFYLSLQAAVAGAGIAIGPIALVADDIASGALSAPRGFTADGTRYALMRNRDSDDVSSFEIVLEWLRTTARPLIF